MKSLQKIGCLNRKFETIPGKYIDAAVLILYAILHLLMSIVHEPWFDESEAWQIARSASLQTLLTEVTHYEGHPPLWHLILMPFAKAGAPYELTLTLISLVFAGMTVWLILRFAPFPRIVRVLLPFTYFFFYQYGVISRVYCVMMLEFVLLAVVYRYRNEKPGYYVIVMALICMTHAYGIVLAGGISLVWLWELWQEEYRTGLRLRDRTDLRLKKVIRDRRIWYLAGLLFVALTVILQIMPREDTYAMDDMAGMEICNPFWKRLLYMLLILPADVTMTNVFSDDGHLSMAYLSGASLLSGCVVGIIIWGLIIYFGRSEDTLIAFVIPYLMFGVFAASVYVSVHHIGIGLLFLIYWIWITMEKPVKLRQETITDTHSYAEGAGKASVEAERLSVGAAKLFTGLALCVSLSWTISACVLDVEKEYSAGRSMAEFIKSNRLDQYRIMAQWEILRDESGKLLLKDTGYCYDAVEIAPYFAENIVYNFNLGRNDRNYITHIRADAEETENTYAAWKEMGQPDVLLMQPDLSELYHGEELSMKDYALVYYAPDEKIWKNVAEYHGNYIYIRRTLLEETGLKEIQVHSLQ